MANIKESFEMLLKEKNLPINYLEIEGGHHLYRLQFRATKSRDLAVEIILQNSDNQSVDVQVIYRNLHGLKDYHKRHDALELINELNEMKTGYYCLHLALDGEIFLRTLLRVGEDVMPLYETIVFGSTISQRLIPELTKQLGESRE